MLAGLPQVARRYRNSSQLVATGMSLGGILSTSTFCLCSLFAVELWMPTMVESALNPHFGHFGAIPTIDWRRRGGPAVPPIGSAKVSRPTTLAMV